MQASSLCTSKVALSLLEDRNYKFPKCAKTKSSDLDAIERHSGKNKNTVHEKKPPSGKRKRSHTSSLFFLWGHEFPSFSPIFQKRDRLRDDEDVNKGGSETAITIVRSQGTGIIGGVALLPLWQFSPLSILGMCYSAREACSHLPFLRQSRADNECPTCRRGRRRKLWTSGSDGNDSPSTQEQTYQKKLSL